METLPLSDVRSTLSSIVERVEGTHERVLVTRNGRPAAVLISPEDLEGLEEDSRRALGPGDDGAVA